MRIFSKLRKLAPFPYINPDLRFTADPRNSVLADNFKRIYSWGMCLICLSLVRVVGAKTDDDSVLVQRGSADEIFCMNVVRGPYMRHSGWEHSIPHMLSALNNLNLTAQCDIATLKNFYKNCSDKVISNDNTQVATVSACANFTKISAKEFTIEFNKVVTAILPFINDIITNAHLAGDRAASILIRAFSLLVADCVLEKFLPESIGSGFELPKDTTYLCVAVAFLILSIYSGYAAPLSHHSGSDAERMGKLPLDALIGVSFAIATSITARSNTIKRCFFQTAEEQRLDRQEYNRLRSGI